MLLPLLDNLLLVYCFVVVKCLSTHFVYYDVSIVALSFLMFSRTLQLH